MGEDFQTLGARLPVTISLALCGVGLAVGAALVVRRAARRKRLGLAVESSLVMALKLASIVVAAIFCAVIYKEGAPVPVLFAAVAAALGAFTLRRTRLGRYAFAIGGNSEAARLSGVPVAKVTMAIYIAIGVLTAFAGIVAAARTNGVTPGNAGLMRELHVITAVVIGGTSLTGGRASIVGTVLGALLLETIRNGLNLLNVPPAYQRISVGLVLVVALAILGLRGRLGQAARA